MENISTVLKQTTQALSSAVVVTELDPLEAATASVFPFWEDFLDDFLLLTALMVIDISIFCGI